MTFLFHKTTAAFFLCCFFASVPLELGIAPAVADSNTGWYSHYCPNAGSNLDLNSCLAQYTSKNAEESATGAANRGQESERNALRAASLGDQIGKDRDQLETELARSQAHADARARAEAENSLLGRSYLPPKEMKDDLQALGLQTNRDLHTKGEKIQKELYTHAEKLAAVSAEQIKSAQQALQAAEKLSGFQKTTEARVQGMKSIEGVKAISENSHAGSKGNSNDFGVSFGTPNILAGSGSDKNPSPNTSKQNSEISAKTPSSLAQEMAKYPATKEGRNNLRDLLKTRLAEAKKGNDAASVKNIESKLARLEEASKKEELSSKATREPASNLADLGSLSKVPSFNPGSESETRGEIGQILSGFEKQLESEKSSAENSEASDISLFERVKQPIRRCLERKCLVLKN